MIKLHQCLKHLKKLIMYFVEGGGQPIHGGKEMAESRGGYLRELDEKSELRFSHENPDVIRMYEEYFQKPLGHRSHRLLHTDHDAWEMPRSPRLANRE